MMTGAAAGAVNLAALVKQGHPHTLEERAIAARGRQVLHAHAAGERAGDLAPGLVHELGHVDVDDPERIAAEPREVDDVIDEPIHRRAVGTHDMEQSQLLGVQARFAALQQHAGEAVHRAQRGTQVVRDRVTQHFELAVGRFEPYSAGSQLRLQAGDFGFSIG
jgi:hypothetical protein